MRDFTIEMYGTLVRSFARRYRITRVDDFVESHSLETAVVALRHDVDRNVAATVRCAEILADIGVYGTFYFRYPYTFRPGVIKHVERLGHEVGYHYEVLSKAKGDLTTALRLFAIELDAFRAVSRVRTACMHGSPLSRWDNKEIWKHATMSQFGLIAEPYLTFDFSEVLYLTDTGRTWAGARFSVRDKVVSDYRLNIRTTNHLIGALARNELPRTAMVTIHPERWAASLPGWTWQLVGQSLKNIAKAVLVRARP